jgi:ion channel
VAFDALASRSVGEVMAAWLALILVFGFIYCIVEALGGQGLLEHGQPVPATWKGFRTALYFSFVTATSVGYGDVVPAGWMRALAILEAASGLIIFGFVVSKFVSRRQDEVIAEIHNISFEERLDRIQTNLHLVLSELQQVSADCAGSQEAKPRSIVRAESAVLVFAGELRTIHDLLYRPQRTPAEDVLEGILANLCAAFGALAELVACMPSALQRSEALHGSLRAISRLGMEICGECVPREHAPALRIWMDRIQRLASGLSS